MNDDAVRPLPPETQLAIDGTGVPPVTIRRCVMCRRKLKAQPWARLGIGPTCAKNYPGEAAHLRALLDKDERTEAGHDAQDPHDDDAEMPPVRH